MGQRLEIQFMKRKEYCHKMKKDRSRRYRGGLLRRLAIGGLSAAMAVSSLGLGTAVPAYAAEIPAVYEEALNGTAGVSTPLLITEIVADTHQADQTTASGTDAFEYVEIYNSSSAPVNLDQYLIQNINGSKVTDWEIPQGMTLEAGATLVVWISNEASASLGMENFRAYYGIGEDVQVVKTTELVNGFSNSGERSIRITVRATGQTITQITYNDGDQKAQTKMGINFGCTPGQVQQPTLSYDQNPTPGTRLEEQQISGTYQVGEQPDAAVTVTADTKVSAGASYTLTAATDLQAIVTTAYVEVTVSSQSSQYPLTYNGGTFTGSVPAQAFAGEEQFTCQVFMSDGVNTASSQPITVSVDGQASQAELPAPLLITEIVPNTDNVDGSDAYEYFELYNGGSQTVELDSYSFYYDNGNSVREWKLNQEGLTLDAGETLVVWVKNTANTNAGYTESDFNDYYRTAFVMGENLATVDSDGFSNSGSRSLSLRTKTGQTLYTAAYNASDSSDGSLAVNEAITFDYNQTGAAASYDGTAAPGLLNADQSIQGQYTFPAAVENPSVTVQAPEQIGVGESWTVSVSGTNLTETILRARLRIYAAESTDPAVVADMTYQGDVLQTVFSYDQVSEMGDFQYEVELWDGTNRALSGRQTVTVENAAEVDTSKAPALTITEIIPDTSNVSGADAYEFIEIYNNSNRDIDLKDYKLYYNYPDNGDSSDVIWWETEESRILKAGESLVFWVKNGSNDSLTIDDFNGAFGTNLTEDQLIEISSGGMANSGARGVKIATNVKDVLDYITYNMNGADNTTADRSITYQNRYSDGSFTSVMVSDDSEPTPGRVTDSEKPRYQAELPNEAAAPVLTDRTADTFDQEESLVFELEAVSQDTAIKTVRLYLRDNNSTSFEVYNLLRESGDVFAKELPSVDLYGKQYYEYYFEVSDGYQTVNTEIKTVQNEEPQQTGDSLNLAEGEYLSGVEAIIGTGGDLEIDGTAVAGVASINGDARIAFDASQTDVFFKNAAAIGEDVLGVFNEGTYDAWATYSYAVDEHYFDAQTGEITIAFHAGNKANNLEHNIENNDDFVLKNIRLILPDGVSLRPVKYEAVQGIGAVEHTEDNWRPDEPYDMGTVSSETEINMGDGTSKVEILYVTFRLTPDSFNALRYDLDTTTLTDGSHSISSGTCTVNVIVDNTAPVITVNLEEGASYRNQVIEAEASDALSEEVRLTALLDGESIELPYTIDNKNMETGSHVLQLTALDAAGNKAEKTIQFSVPEEDADVEGDLLPADGALVHGDPTFFVQVTDPTGDDMTVTFKRGERYELGDANITQSSGVSDTSGTDSQTFEQASGDGFPWEQFDIELGGTAGESSVIRVSWEGNASNEKTFLYVYNTSTESWDRMEAEQTADGAGTAPAAEQAADGDGMTLTADIELADHLDGSVVHVMVQSGEGYTPAQYAPGEASESAAYNENDTPREDYDFTFVVESDTQYYNEDYEGNPSQDVDGQYQYQLDIHNWIINNRERMNIQYLFHDGDIIDDEPLIPEWENADKAYEMLDQAGIPYGVLAGNHDVGHLSGDYTNFSKYFGEDRYNQNPWYGESYKDNRGHYDLITVDGIDFIMIYMGWGIGDEEIQWMNDVLAQYPERKAILNFHEYLLASGGLGEEPQRIYDEVVAVNPNVCMVLSGHYHNAQTRIDSFDDDGDGIAERNVYQLLFDYQGLSQGGMGYIRLMHFDMENEKIIFRTYSPSLDDYDAKDETGIGDVAGINGEEEFEISFAELGIVPQTKTLETTALTVDVYSDEVIGTAENVESGMTAVYTWTGAPEGTFGWYAEITDAYGGLTRTAVNYVTVEKSGYEPVITLPGSSANTIGQGDVFDPLDGVTAADYQGNDITSRITVTGQVDTAVPGTYELTYKVTDEAGNTATAVRTVRVMADNTGGQGGGNGGNSGGNGGNGGGNGGQSGNGQTGSGSGQSSSGSQQTGSSTQTGDAAGRYIPFYTVGILAGFAALAALFKKKSQGDIKSQD